VTRSVTSHTMQRHHALPNYISLTNSQCDQVSNIPHNATASKFRGSIIPPQSGLFPSSQVRPRYTRRLGASVAVRAALMILLITVCLTINITDFRQLSKQQLSYRCTAVSGKLQMKSNKRASKSHQNVCGLLAFKHPWRRKCSCNRSSLVRLELCSRQQRLNINNVHWFSPTSVRLPHLDICWHFNCITIVWFVHLCRRASSWADSVITLLRRLYLLPTLKDVIDQYLLKCVTVAQLSEVFWVFHLYVRCLLFLCCEFMKLLIVKNIH